MGAGASFILGLEGAFTLAGLILIFRLAFGSGARARPAGLAPWPGSAGDLLLFFLCAVCGAIAVPNAVGFLLRAKPAGMEIRLLLTLAAFEFGLLAGLGFYQACFSRRPLRFRPAPLRSLVDGGATLLVSLPIVFCVGAIWSRLLELFGLPVRSQDVVVLFQGIHSPVLRAAFVVLAAVVAPFTEELLFRAGLFRFCRGRMPRWLALLFPALVFGGAHLLQAPLDGLAALAQLVTLGVVFSLAYERTGRIGTAIVAHALFNLNTIVLLLAGLNV